MARDHNRHALSAAEAELLRQFQGSIAGMGSDQLKSLLPQLLAATSRELDPFGRPSVPSMRRPRRADVVTYRVRVDLMGTKPPLWRRLELASDLFLNELHDVLQAAFGWTDSHLHEFASGKDYYDRASEHYLCPFQVDEGDAPGVPEEDVRLDEVLTRQGEKLFYEYDFGDGWMHVIKLESVVPRDSSAPRAVCTDGRRPGPSEDCGGVGGYELIAAALDPAHPEHAESVAEYARMYGGEVEPGDYAPTPFDLDEVNMTLAWLSVDKPDLQGPLEELVEAIRSTHHRRLFQRMIADADLGAPIDIDADTAARMVAPYRWLLDRVGTDGVKLTGAGYLPPLHVEAAMSELRLGEEWIGKGNREVQTLPVLHLRESAQAMGLLRKYRGKLVLTPRGRAVRNDPLALWWHLAEQMPPASNDACENQAGLIFLAALASQSMADVDETTAELLTMIGWMGFDEMPLSPSTASFAAWNTKAALRRLGSFVEDRRGLLRSESPTPAGVTFARAALRTWPSAP
jgi:hypothetical protein